MDIKKLTQYLKIDLAYQIAREKVQSHRDNFQSVLKLGPPMLYTVWYGYHFCSALYLRKREER